MDLAVHLMACSQPAAVVPVVPVAAAVVPVVPVVPVAAAVAPVAVAAMAHGPGRTGAWPAGGPGGRVHSEWASRVAWISGSASMKMSSRRGSKCSPRCLRIISTAEATGSAAR